MHTTTLPDLAALVDPLLGRPYAEYDCWHLARYLFREGWGLDLVENPRQAAQALAEIWFVEDGGDPLSLLQPWDLLILRIRQPWSSHLGLVVTPQVFVHTRQRTGVALEPVRRWRTRVLQIARLRRLVA